MRSSTIQLSEKWRTFGRSTDAIFMKPSRKPATKDSISPRSGLPIIPVQNLTRYQDRTISCSSTSTTSRFSCRWCRTKWISTRRNWWASSKTWIHSRWAITRARKDFRSRSEEAINLHLLAGVAIKSLRPPHNRTASTQRTISPSICRRRWRTARRASYLLIHSTQTSPLLAWTSTRAPHTTIEMLTALARILTKTKRHLSSNKCSKQYHRIQKTSRHWLTATEVNLENKLKTLR